MSALPAVLESLSQLDHMGLSEVIEKARELRAEAWKKRLSELVTAPVHVWAECSYESSDEGGTLESWSATYKGPNDVGFDDGELQDGVYDEEREPAIHAIFGAGRDRTDEQVDAAMAEFNDLALAYARWCAEGEPQVEFTVEPVG